MSKIKNRYKILKPINASDLCKDEPRTDIMTTYIEKFGYSDVEEYDLSRFIKFAESIDAGINFFTIRGYISLVYDKTREEEIKTDFKEAVAILKTLSVLIEKMGYSLGVKNINSY